MVTTEISSGGRIGKVEADASLAHGRCLKPLTSFRVWSSAELALGTPKKLQQLPGILALKLQETTSAHCMAGAAIRRYNCKAWYDRHWG